MGDMLNEFLEKTWREREKLGYRYDQYYNQDYTNYLCDEGGRCHSKEEGERLDKEFKDNLPKMMNRQRNEIIIDNLLFELSLISDISLKILVVECVKSSPHEYWEKPSAFYQGHHPNDEHKPWGNLIHAKRTVCIGSMLSEPEKLEHHDKDLLIASLILHDIGKYGIDSKAEKVQKDHPQIARQLISQTTNDGIEIANIIETHMGQWHNPQPSTKLQYLCHDADYIASRTNIIIPIQLDFNHITPAERKRRRTAVGIIEGDNNESN